MKSSISPRAKVIEAAVHLEANITLYLCAYLNIDHKKSVLFGFKRGSLSFDNKLEMLLELNYLNLEKREKFRKFSEIRNKFAHVSTILNFTDCYAAISGAENKLSSWYAPKKSLTIEEKNRELFNHLTGELFDDLVNFQTISDKADEKKKLINYYISYVDQITKEMKLAGDANKSFEKALNKIHSAARRKAKVVNNSGYNSLESLGMDVNKMSLI